ncbi:vesicular glutamate transporter 3-like isoform X3 [Daktulosphaira vitifoliae]|uniref:vesicular glutamate transporter 3-like isoform X3 n=1 Tax=Daktulosphaira vitifoliae TaxID=58002 RepID=UPI0021A9E37A|nr:vesicular glutamate transporter 3-like isoform X3 [Daktulosphaira vitifoliae]
MLKRTILWYMTFWGFAMNYMLRMNLNIAIVSMVKTIPKHVNLTKFSQCYISKEVPNNEFLNSTFLVINMNSVQKENTFEWDENQQNIVLGAFYWLHIIMQIPGGILSQKYSAKTIYGFSNGFVAFLTCFIPLSAYFKYRALVLIRIIQGFVAGAAWPAMYALTGKWIPPNERSHFMSAYLGCSFGTAMTYVTCGYISSFLGWEMIFYITGALGILWFLFWTLLVHDSPGEHPSIGKEERLYIEKSLGRSSGKTQIHPTPWKSIVFSVPLIVNIISQIGVSWGMYTLSIQAPSYFSFVLGLNLKQVGIWTGVPHLFSWLFSLVCGFVCDYLIKNKVLSTTNVRKLACMLCNLAQGLFILGLAYSGCNHVLAIVNLVLAVAMVGAASSGQFAGIVDLAPNYAGILQGLVGIVSMGITSISPIIVGLLTYQRTIEQWQQVFMLSAAFCWITGLIYVLFGKSEMQSWNNKTNKQEIKPMI